MVDYRHLNAMTTQNGMLQFSQLQTPDPGSGYTLDDNARALIVALNREDGYELPVVMLLTFIVPNVQIPGLILSLMASLVLVSIPRIVLVALYLPAAWVLPVIGLKSEKSVSI